MQQTTRIAQLYESWLKGTETAEETIELGLLLQDAFNEQALLPLMEQGWKLPAGEAEFSQEQRIILAQNILNKYPNKVEEKEPKITILRKRRWTAAAILILAIGSGIYYLNNPSWKSGKSGESGFRQNDIMPGGNRAILTIGNKTIELSSNKEGIINQGNKLTYSDGSAITETTYNLKLTTYNSLTTPRGGQYQAVLPDGSKVWLNAASSIKFPSAFTTKERRVEVSGEVYFEIAKDVSKPFKVNSEGQEIEVLGTSFNINTYEDEPIKRTTLLTGLIKVKTNKNEVILKPNQQAQIINYSLLITNSSSDVIAWKDGLFDFTGVDASAIMRQLERWYNIRVTYEGPLPKIQIEGKINRGVQLSSMMEWFAAMGINSRMEGKTLILSEQ